MVSLDLIGQIYDVPLGRSNWDDVIERIRRQFGAEQSLMFAIDERSGGVEMLSISNPEESLWQEYVDYYHASCPWTELFEAGNLPKNSFVAGDRYVPYKELVKTEYFQGWWVKNGVYYTSGGRFRCQDGRLIQLNLPRPKGAGSYEDTELAVLNQYAAHIVRALALQAAIPMHAHAPQPDYDSLAVGYGLTPAEAKLVEVLVDTGSLKRSADRLHRSYHTVRSQLRSVLQKTDTNSQVQLMRLIHQRSATAGQRPQAAIRSVTG